MINYSVWCFWSFFHFLNSNVPDKMCHKQKWHVLFFSRIKLGVNRFKNSVTFFYFYFFTFLRKKCITVAQFLHIASKIWKLLGLYKKNNISSLNFSIKWNFTVYRDFLPTVEKVSQIIQLNLFEKSNHEKRPFNN